MRTKIGKMKKSCSRKANYRCGKIKGGKQEPSQTKSPLKWVEKKVIKNKTANKTLLSLCPRIRIRILLRISNFCFVVIETYP